MRGVNFMLSPKRVRCGREGKKWLKEQERELLLHAQNANSAITTFTKTKRTRPTESSLISIARFAKSTPRIRKRNNLALSDGIGILYANTN